MARGMIGHRGNGRRMTGLEAAPPPPMPMQEPPRGMIGASAPRGAKPKGGGLFEMFGYDPEATGMKPLEWFFSGPQQTAQARERMDKLKEAEMEAAETARYKQTVQGLLGDDPFAMQAALYNPGEFWKSYTPDNVAKRKAPIAGDKPLIDPNTYENVYTPPPELNGQSNNVQSTFVDKNGQLNLVMRNGEVVPTGKQARESYGTIDYGGVPYMVNRNAPGMVPLATPENIGNTQATIQDITTRGKAQTEAALNLPDAISRAERSIETIDALMAHPGFKKRYGIESLGGLMPALPGGQGAGAQAYIDQLTGAAFLEAFETLKGGGQITEMEGKKATAAITRLQDQRISPAEAEKAMQELREVARTGLLKAKVKANLLTAEDFAKMTDEELEFVAKIQ